MKIPALPIKMMKAKSEPLKLETRRTLSYKYSDMSTSTAASDRTICSPSVEHLRVTDMKAHSVRLPKFLDSDS